MPSNACFASGSCVGVPRLRRVLRALAWLYPEIGYCQGTGMVSTAREGMRVALGVFPRPLRVDSLTVQGTRTGSGVEVGVPKEGWSCQMWFQP